MKTTTQNPRRPLSFLTHLLGHHNAALLLRVWWLPVALGALALSRSQLQAASPGWQGARISFSCLEDSVTPIGPVQADGEDTLALLTLRIWAKAAWKEVRPLSIDPAQQEATYALLEEEAARLHEFTRTYPDSGWTPPIQARLGRYYHRIGRSSVALQLWDEAWRLLAGRSDRPAKRLADRTVAQYATLLAQLGHADKLALILAECAGRSLPQTECRELYRNARTALSAMNGAPQWCYRCGSFSVGLVGDALRGTRDASHAVARLQAPIQGFSLQQLTELSRDIGLDLVPVNWGETKEIPVPAVIHWQDQHYSAILSKSGNWYVVLDPTLKVPRRLHRSAIQEEATGFFLAPRSVLAGPWALVNSADAATVIGRGYDAALEDSCDEPSCPFGSGPGGYGGTGGGPQGSSGGGCGLGNCVSADSAGVLEWFVSDPYVNLWLRDVPLRWQPAIGPEFAVRLAYRQRGSPSWYEMNPDHFTQLGSAWQLPWRGAIRVDARGEDGGQFMRAFTPTGSGFTYEFEGSGSTSGTHFINNSLLERVIVGEELTGANVWYPDGSYDRYGVVTNQDGYLIRMIPTLRTDASGHGVEIQYHRDEDYLESTVVSRVVAPDGSALDFTYSTEEGYTNQVYQMVDSADRTVTLGYDDEYPDRLVGITDCVGMDSAITYDEVTGEIATMVTPYGTTAFSVVSARDGYTEVRSVTVTRPTGAQERFYYRMSQYGTPNSIDPRDDGYTKPDDTPYDTLSEEFVNNNSWYWDARNFANLSTDFKNDPLGYDMTTLDNLRGRGRNWLVEYFECGGYSARQALNAERAPSPDSSAQVRGQITWYDYPDKTYADGIGAQVLPGVIARIMPDGTSAWSWYERNAYGKVTSEVDKWVESGQAKYRTNTFLYAANGVDLVEHRFGPSGGDHRVIGYGYDSNHPHLPMTMTNAVGDVTQYTYDAQQRLTSVLTPAGLLTTNFYGGDDYLATTIDLIGGTPLRTNSYTYQDNHLHTHTDERGLTTTYSYDELGRLTEKSSGNTHESWSFNLASANPNSTGDLQIFEPTSYHDRLTNVTLTAWNADRKVSRVTNALGVVTSTTYCDCGAVESVTQGYGLANAETTWYLYDQQSRLTQVTRPDNSVLQYGYDLPGRRTSETDPIGTTTNTFDNLSRLVAVSNAVGRVQAIVYDLEDQPVTVTDANGVTITSTFDDLGRLRTRTYPDTGAEGFGYTVKGLVAYTNQVGKVTLYGYDAALRKTTETNANLEVISYQYKPSGDLWKLIDGKNQTNTWSYDEYGRVTNKVDQASVEILRYAYDANSRLTNRWSKAKLNTKYKYDAVGSLTNVDYNASTDIRLAYDALNRLTNMVDAAGTNKYTYYAGGQLWTEGGLWASDTVTNTYNTARMRVGLGLAQPTGAWTNGFTYDGGHRLATVISPAGTFTYGYRGPGNLVTNLALPNGSRITNAFDSVGRLASTRLLTSGNSLLDGYAYIYNFAGQRTNLTRTDGSRVTNTYDNIGQLKSARGSGGYSTENLGYLYDTAWNLNKRTNAGTPTTFAVNVKNELTTVGGTSYAYDYNGNLGSAGALYFSYDDENQLASVLLWNTWKNEFTYDGRGRLRVRKDYTWSTYSGSWQLSGQTRYLYDGMRVIQERSSANTPTVAYTRGNDLSGSMEGAGGIGGLLARSHGHSGGTFSTHSFYHADGNGNVTYLVNSAEARAAEYRYDPYGNLRYTYDSLPSGGNRYRFSSKEQMPNSGLYYYGYRFYDPNLQRWLNRDPVGEQGGVNLYGFGPNSPLSGFDPDGSTWRSNERFFWDWLFGRRSRNRYYGGGTVESEEMSKSPGGNGLRDQFYKNGCKNVTGFGYGTMEAYWDTAINPFTADWGSTAFQVGGFAGATAKDNGDGTVTFCIPNTAGINSFFLHIPPDNVFGPNGPMGNISQAFCWTERIDKDKCKCKK